MTYSTDDGRTVTPGLLPAVLRAMRASFRCESVLDAFASPEAPMYSWADKFPVAPGERRWGSDVDLRMGDELQRAETTVDHTDIRGLAAA